ncbi:hypothetical protein RUM44_005215 [Polyplax serrata]|uniref:Uncharacterized protein n=1 Tax=Polyplax serrata TaxID=468196 RepID=A0ABR1AED5_POLSC
MLTAPWGRGRQNKNVVIKKDERNFEDLNLGKGQCTNRVRSYTGQCAYEVFANSTHQYVKYGFLLTT